MNQPETLEAAEYILDAFEATQRIAILALNRLARDRPTHHLCREGSQPRVPSLATAQKRQRFGHLYRHKSAQAGRRNTNEGRNRRNSPRVYRSRLRWRKRIERDSEIQSRPEAQLRADE